MPSKGLTIEPALGGDSQEANSRVSCEQRVDFHLVLCETPYVRHEEICIAALNSNLFKILLGPLKTSQLAWLSQITSSQATEEALRSLLPEEGRGATPAHPTQASCPLAMLGLPCCRCTIE